MLLFAGKRFKDRSVRKRPTVRGSSNNATHYLSDWQNTSLKSLRLACTALNIIRYGSCAAQDLRLFDHYQAHPVDNVVSAASPIVTVSNSDSSSPLLNTNMQEFLQAAELHRFLSR